MPPSPAIRERHARLIAELGGAAAALPVRGPGDSIEIGRFGPLPCWSLGGVPHVATALARTLARRGRPGLLLADDPASARRTLVVSLPPVRAAVVPLDAPRALPLLRLSRLEPQATALGTAMAVAAALDVDAAGRRAFRALRGGIDAAVDALDGRSRRDLRHAWVLLQVTRLLFLRFVESEGWLDGDPAFLQRTVDATLATGGDPARQLLHPLFFGTLNRAPDRRTKRARAFGTVPFLNGGLFEPHPIERAHAWRMPRDAWQSLFALLVDGIEVSLDAGDVGDRVNPELLGRVFEGVMHPDERRAAGTFYTPADLVPPIVRESFASHLAHRLRRGEVAVHDALDDPDAELAAAMLDLRILDPAVGSGAFLVGALQQARGHGRDAARRTRRLVARSLFGVDRNPAAVRLSELRLWLEVLRTMRGRPPHRVAPLPNLDTTIRSGDALLDPLAGSLLPRRSARALAAARLATVTAHGAERRRTLRELRRLERAALDGTLARTAARIERAIEELVEGARDATLFGDRAGLTRPSRARLGGLRAALAGVRRERRRLAATEGTPVFAIESAFAPELASGGFDLVLGNPPWIRAERLPAEARAALAARYRWWQGSGAGWRHLPDVSVAFLERAVELLAPHGTVGFLLPAKLATTRYAATCRGAMSHRTTLHLAADLSTDPRADFEATTYPMALVASRRPADAGHRIRLAFGPDAATVRQAEWQHRDTWSIAAPALAGIAAMLAARHPPLSQRWQPALGLKTGANEVFLDPPASLHPWTRAVVRGRDLATGKATVRHRLLWPADRRGVPWPTLPTPVAEYLAAHRGRLQRRADLHAGPWWQFFRTRTATAPWRVAWADLALTLRPHVLGPGGPVPLNSCYVIACADEADARLLGAWLGAPGVQALARLAAEPAANGYARYGARAVGAVPFPLAVATDAEFAKLSVDPSPDPDFVSRRVGALLGLTPKERGLLDAFVATGR